LILGVPGSCCKKSPAGSPIFSSIPSRPIIPRIAALDFVLLTPALDSPTQILCNPAFHFLFSMGEAPCFRGDRAKCSNFPLAKGIVVTRRFN
jgi:hypothetical protein